MITPQTMAIITRIFPRQRRGQAMALWGATAGVATLVGPILGGVLVDSLGWEWIFFINLPVGVVGAFLAWRLVPRLETQRHRFDWLGVVLSGAGMFLLVFGIQEGHQYDWGTITGVVSVPALIVTGLVVLALFVVWQARNRAEPLVPLRLFRDRNFSLSNLGISSMGFAITAMAFPLMLYAQIVRGLSPTRSALLLVPMAVMSIVLAPYVGRLTDRAHPRVLTGAGLTGVVVSLVWLSREMTPDSATWQLLLPITLLGIGSAAVVGAAERHCHPQPADAARRRGSGRLQRDPPGRRGPRVGRRGRADGLPDRRPGPAVPAVRGRRRARSPTPCSTPSAQPCRRPCCSRRWCCWSAWPACCSTSSPSAAPLPPGRSPPRTWPSRPRPRTDPGSPTRHTITRVPW